MSATRCKTSLIFNQFCSAPYATFLVSAHSHKQFLSMYTVYGSQSLEEQEERICTPESTVYSSKHLSSSFVQYFPDEQGQICFNLQDKSYFIESVPVLWTKFALVGCNRYPELSKSIKLKTREHIKRTTIKTIVAFWRRIWRM